MFQLAASLIICGTRQYPDRAKFLHALGAIPDRAPKEAVIRALGWPDRVEQLRGSEPTEFASQPSKPMKWEIWLYGTDTPNGAATLAKFQVFHGRIAYHLVNGEPPPTGVIAEAELRRAMHIAMDSFPDWTSDSNDHISTWVAKTVDSLLPFGEAKYKAIIGECGRVTAGDVQPCLSFLAYALFDPPEPPGYFDVHGLVWNAPLPEDGPAAHPRWPIDIVKNAPILHGRPLGMFSGYAPSFDYSFGLVRDRIHLRSSPLTVPN